MAINGRVYAPLEFMHSYTWYKSRGTDNPDREETGWGLGYRRLAGWFAFAKRNHHLPVSCNLQTNRTDCSRPGSVAGRDTGDGWHYAARWTEFCAAPHA